MVSRSRAGDSTHGLMGPRLWARCTKAAGTPTRVPTWLCQSQQEERPRPRQQLGPRLTRVTFRRDPELSQKTHLSPGLTSCGRVRHTDTIWGPSGRAATAVFWEDVQLGTQPRTGSSHSSEGSARQANSYTVSAQSPKDMNLGRQKRQHMGPIIATWCKAGCRAVEEQSAQQRLRDWHCLERMAAEAC